MRGRGKRTDLQQAPFLQVAPFLQEVEGYDIKARMASEGHTCASDGCGKPAKMQVRWLHQCARLRSMRC